MVPQEFFKKYAPFAIISQIKYGVPASVTLAQAALESAWGESGLTRNFNNFFGIKAQAGYKGSATKMDTTEVYTGQVSTINAAFRAYQNAQESFDDHAKFLVENKRYKSLFTLHVTDYIKWAQGLKAAGYATDPIYDSKLINLVVKYNLQKYDSEGVLKKKLQPPQ